MRDANAETTVTGRQAGLGAFVRYWGPPIVIGLAAGLAIWAAWQFLFVSEVQRLVNGWRWAETEEEVARNDALAEKIRALGPSAGRDLLRAFDAAPCEYTDHKLWIGELLLDKPFEDATAMADLARNGDECDRRVASTLIALLLGREADPDLVLPGILDWLEDLDADYHDYPINAVRTLRPLYGDWDARAKAALLRLAAKRPPREDVPPELDWTDKDREDACAALAEWLPDSDVLALFLELLGDDIDMTGPRVQAIRALSANGVFTPREPWIAALASRDPVIRQATAENLFRVDEASKNDPEYDAAAFDSGLTALHVDESEYARVASIDTQAKRRRPTMLPVIDQLLEDWDEWVRYEALKAVSVFRAEPGAEARNGMLLNLLATSSADPDLNGTLLALFSITGKLPEGIGEQHVDRRMWEIDEAVLEAFKKDIEGRRQAVAFYGEELAGRAVWTPEARRETLDRMLGHADGRNRERAAEELRKMR